MEHYRGKAALVTGANRGMARAYVEALAAAGAKRIYAAVRDEASVQDLAAAHEGRVVPVKMDVTQPETVKAAAERASDIDLVINNAGVATFQRLIGASSTDGARLEMDVNYFGALNVIRAFAPVMKANGGGAIINMSSIAGLVNFPVFGSYSASKAAVHSMIQGARGELAADGISVVGVYPGPVETDMGANIPMDRASASSVVQTVLERAAAGEEDIFPDGQSAELQRGLSANAKGIEKHLASMAAAAQ